jgi:hypothetical protein
MPQWGAFHDLDRRPRVSPLLGAGAASEPAGHVQFRAAPDQQGVAPRDGRRVAVDGGACRNGVRSTTWIAAPASALCSVPVRLRNPPATYNFAPPPISRGYLREMAGQFCKLCKTDVSSRKAGASPSTAAHAAMGVRSTTRIAAPARIPDHVQFGAERAQRESDEPRPIHHRRRRSRRVARSAPCASPRSRASNPGAADCIAHKWDRHESPSTAAHAAMARSEVELQRPRTGTFTPCVLQHAVRARANGTSAGSRARCRRRRRQRAEDSRRRTPAARTLRSARRRGS